MMEKLRFDFTVLPAPDGKTNTIGITSVAIPDGKTYAIPKELQPISYHKEVAKTNTYAKVRNTLKKRPDQESLDKSNKRYIGDLSRRRREHAVRRPILGRNKPKGTRTDNLPTGNEHVGENTPEASGKHKWTTTKKPEKHSREIPTGKIHNKKCKPTPMD